MNPYLILGVVVACIASGFAGSKVGAKLERSEWQEKEIRQQAAYQAKYKELSDAARAKEQEHVASTAKAQKEYQDAVTKMRRVYDAENARLRDGSLVLRVPINPATCGSTAPEAGSDPSRSTGRATAELSGEIAQAIGRYGEEVDEVVNQLKLCQKIIVSDRQ